MSRALCYLEVEGQTVGSLREFLHANKYTGYPIVTTRDELCIVGFISREELRSGLEQAINKREGVDENTPCYFGSAIEVQKAAERHSQSIFVDFSPWIDDTPIQVSSSTPLNLVFDMFKKLGLRYVLVSQRGVLLGVITKKDILQHIQSTQPGKGFFVGTLRRNNALSEKYNEPNVMLPLTNLNKKDIS